MTIGASLSYSCGQSDVNPHTVEMQRYRVNCSCTMKTQTQIFSILMPATYAQNVHFDLTEVLIGTALNYSWRHSTFNHKKRGEGGTRKTEYPLEHYSDFSIFKNCGVDIGQKTLSMMMHHLPRAFYSSPNTKQLYEV